MAGNTAVLVVRMLGDATGATKAIAQVEMATASAADATGKSGKKMAGVWTAVAGAALYAAKAAAQLEQSSYAVATVFGESAPDVMAWAEGMASMGLSTAQAAQGAAVLGVSLKSAGIPMEHVAEISTKLVETSAQLAQVMGGSAAEAVAAMGAALRGEYDSLERFGIALTADAVAAEAMRLSQEGLTFASEQQAKAVATLSLIQQKSTAILADAEEGTVTAQMAMDHLKASVTNLAAAIGGPLLTVLTPLIDALAKIIDAVVRLISESELLQALLEALNAVLEACQAILEALEPVIQLIVDAMKALGDAIAVVVGWVESAIDAFSRLISKIHEAIDTLTFWNDTYQASSVPSSAMLSRFGPTPAGRGPAQLAGSQPVSISVNGMVLDADGTARAIRKLLRDQKRRGWTAAA